MDTTLQEYPLMIKEIITNDYSVCLEQHKHLYVVRYNGLPTSPFANLTVAIDIFEKLLNKEHKINCN